MAGVINDVPDGSRMIGIPATPEREQKIKQAALSKLPEMRRQLKQLQTTVDAVAAATGRLRRNAARRVPATRENCRGSRPDAEEATCRDSPASMQTTTPSSPDRRPRPAPHRPDGRLGTLSAGGGRGAAAPRLRGLLPGRGRPRRSARWPRSATISSWIGLAKFGAAIRYFHRHGVTEATMAGKIHKVRAVPAVAVAPASARPADDPHVRSRISSRGARTAATTRCLGAIVDEFAARRHPLRPGHRLRAGAAGRTRDN